MSSDIDFRVQSRRAWLRIENGPGGCARPWEKEASGEQFPSSLLEMLIP